MSYTEPRSYHSDDPIKMFRKMGVKWVQDQIMRGRFDGDDLVKARSFVEYACQRANLRWVIVSVAIAMLGLAVTVGIFVIQERPAWAYDMRLSQNGFDDQGGFGSR